MEKNDIKFSEILDIGKALLWTVAIACLINALMEMKETKNQEVK